MINLIRLTIFLFVFKIPSFVQGQNWKAKWTNKDKGTYVISFSYMPVIPKDSPDNIGISIKMYELSPVGCKRIEGWAKINGKKYFVYDSTNYVDDEGNNDISNYFFIKAAEGIYEIIANPGNEYYLIKTERYNLLPATSYTFYFYFVRKDALVRNK